METIRELAPKIRDGTVSPVTLTEEYLQRIERLNPEIDAYITVLGESALEEAEKSERQIREGRYLGPLHGIPMAIKDIIAIEGVRCTAGSSILESYMPDSDAPVIRRIRAAGGIILGTANLHEFALGVTSANPYFGAVKNPHDTRRIAGGSSGGSAAAVAAGMAIASLGTDTSGSVRTPAALCGVTGLKPTYGRISRDGVIPLSESLDHVGVLSRGSWNAAAVLEVVAGHEQGDRTTLDVRVRDIPKSREAPVRYQGRCASQVLPGGFGRRRGGRVRSVLGEARRDRGLHRGRRGEGNREGARDLGADQTG